MGWNPIKSAKKAIKSVTGGIKKAFKGISKIRSKVVDSLRSVRRELKRFAKSDLGKIVIAAALIYVGGAAYLAANSATGLTGASFASSLASPGAVVGQLGIGAATTTPEVVGAATTGAEVGSMATVAGAEAAGTTAGLTTTGTSIGLNGAASTGGAIGGSATAGGTAVGGAASGGMLSEGVKYGAMMVGGNAIAGAMQAKGAVEAEKETEKARQRYINGNIVPNVDFNNLAGLHYNPMTGQERAQSTEAYLPEHLRVNTNLTSQYSGQGLLSKGAV